MPLPIDPLSLGALIQGGIGLAKGITGGFQASRARKRLKELDKNEPKRYIPSAILERAKEPVAEEFMEAQEMGAQRRTSQGIGALSQGGSRAILGGLPQITDQERIGEMQRAGQYEQARQDALGTLGAAQTNMIEANRRDWMNRVLAQTQQMGAGTQNIMTGLEDVGKAALTYGLGKVGDDLTMGDSPSMRQEDVSVVAKDVPSGDVINTPSTKAGDIIKRIPDEIGEPPAMPTGDVGGNPFELPDGGLRVPLPQGGTVDIPATQMGDIMDNGDGTMTIPTPAGPVTVPSFKIGSTKKGGVIPTPVGTIKF